jgi:hypothetical protein
MLCNFFPVCGIPLQLTQREGNFSPGKIKFQEMKKAIGVLSVKGETWPQSQPFLSFVWFSPPPPPSLIHHVVKEI